jgi:hypothetical protein
VVRIMYPSGETSKEYTRNEPFLVYCFDVTPLRYIILTTRLAIPCVLLIMYRSGVTSKQYTRNG